MKRKRDIISIQLVWKGYSICLTQHSVWKGNMGRRTFHHLYSFLIIAEHMVCKITHCSMTPEAARNSRVSCGERHVNSKVEMKL